MSNINRDDRYVRRSNGMRVVRGMVFWYNPNPSIDKNSEPVVWVKGNKFRDHRQYGDRGWLVVSNDVGNLTSSVCTIVPITSQTKNSISPTRVHFYFEGIPLVILCEQAMTVNISELTDFRYFLQDSIMDKVSEALRVHFQIPENKDSVGTMYSLKNIEDIIDGIVRRKVSQYRVNTAKQVDIDDAVLRIGESLENLLKGEYKETDENKKEVNDCAGFVYHDYLSDVDTPNVVDSSGCGVQPVDGADIKSQTDKFYSKYPSLRPEVNKSDTRISWKDDSDLDEKGEEEKKTKTRKTSRKSVSSRTHRKWDDETIKEFMDDMEKLPPTEVADKWGYESVSKIYKVRYYLQSKINKMEK